MLESLREEVWEKCLLLPESGLVTMHSGNVSGRDFGTGFVVIKPSGVDYKSMKPKDLVVVDLEGRVVEGGFRPSVDTPHHLYLYKAWPEVGGIIHTHSPYATSFAALGQPIPVYLTAIADEFGGPIPVTEFATNEGDAIARAIMRAVEGRRCPAVLLKNHGVFTWGRTPTDAFKAAVMVEDVAKICHLALLRGVPEELPPEEVERWYKRYHEGYGQK
ncbi:MAG: L-ribulose-5-phosphate 4-epimerase [bacterium]